MPDATIQTGDGNWHFLELKVDGDLSEVHVDGIAYVPAIALARQSLAEKLGRPLYMLCRDCDHFIEANEWADIERHQIAPYVHLDDGEKEHDHDAMPSVYVHALVDWQIARPDLFLVYADGKIGPNSEHYRARREQPSRDYTRITLPSGRTILTSTPEAFE